MSEQTATSVSTDRVGYIGLGSQGGPMARRIVEDGFATVLWARRQETLDAYADTAAEYASSPADLGSRVDIACVCVVDDAGVDQVVSGADGLLSGMAAGGVIVIQSTVHPETVQRVAEQAAAKGISVLDAPVSGGGPAVEAKRLLVMVGGEAEVLDRVRPVFGTYANPVVHLGPVGAGQRAKLINNLMLTANLGVLESAYALARSLHVDPEQLSTVLGHGSGNSYAVNVLRGPDFVLGPMGAMAGPLLQKDARLVIDLAQAEGAEPGTVLVAADAALASMGCPR